MKRVSGLIRIVCTPALGVIASLSTHAQQAGPPDGRIDGSSEAKFEASVAALQNGLPTRRRENFEVALAVIWMSNTRGARGLDINGDGNINAIDSQLLADDTYRLLLDIQRGDLLPSIERRANKDSQYTVADYVKRLDGLGYDEVFDLAGRPSELPLPSRKPSQPRDSSVIDAKTGKTFNEAIDALNLRNFAGARSAIGKLNISRLSPYERTKVEQVLFVVSYGEGKLAEAREHLQVAIDAGGLDAQEVSAALVQIRVIDSRLAANPPGLLAMPKFP
jgi:hypothetical protein